MLRPFCRKTVLLAIACLFALVACAPEEALRAQESAMVGRPAATTNNAEEASQGTLWYRIVPNDQVLDVTIRLFDPPSTTSFFLPGAWAGRSDYARRIRIKGARDSDGSRFMTIDRKGGRIDVESGNSPWVELEYAVDLAAHPDSPRLHPRRVGDVLLAYDPSFLILPSQQVLSSTREIPIELNVPKAWTVYTTWPKIHDARSRVNDSRRVLGFLAEDGRALRDAFLVAGTRLRVSGLGEDAANTLEIAHHPDFRGDREGIARIVERVVSHYRGLFGDLGPVRVYVDIQPDTTSTHLSGLGRRSGFVLELPEKAQADAETSLLIAHEALHLWNGHHLVPDAGSERDTRWFKEGITHYIALKALRTLEIVDEKMVLAELASSAANYVRNPVSLGREGRELDRARYPYDFGVLLGLAIDAELFRSTRGRSSIEDWLVALQRRQHSTGSAVYDTRALYEALRTVEAEQNANLASLWNRHIRRKKPIDVPALFERLGLHWLPPEPSRQERLIAFDRPAPLYRELLRPR